MILEHARARPFGLAIKVWTTRDIYSGMLIATTLSHGRTAEHWDSRA